MSIYSAFSSVIQEAKTKVGSGIHAVQTKGAELQAQTLSAISSAQQTITQPFQQQTKQAIPQQPSSPYTSTTVTPITTISDAARTLSRAPATIREGVGQIARAHTPIVQTVKRDVSQVIQDTPSTIRAAPSTVREGVEQIIRGHEPIIQTVKKDVSHVIPKPPPLSATDKASPLSPSQSSGRSGTPTPSPGSVEQPATSRGINGTEKPPILSPSSSLTHLVENKAGQTLRSIFSERKVSKVPESSLPSRTTAKRTGLLPSKTPADQRVAKIIKPYTDFSSSVKQGAYDLLIAPPLTLAVAERYKRTEGAFQDEYERHETQYQKYVKDVEAHESSQKEYEKKQIELERSIQEYERNPTQQGYSKVRQIESDTLNLYDQITQKERSLQAQEEELAPLFERAETLQREESVLDALRGKKYGPVTRGIIDAGVMAKTGKTPLSTETSKLSFGPTGELGPTEESPWYGGYTVLSGAAEKYRTHVSEPYEERVTQRFGTSFPVRTTVGLVKAPGDLAESIGMAIPGTERASRGLMKHPIETAPYLIVGGLSLMGYSTIEGLKEDPGETIGSIAGQVILTKGAGKALKPAWKPLTSGYRNILDLGGSKGSKVPELPKVIVTKPLRPPKPSEIRIGISDPFVDDLLGLRIHSQSRGRSQKIPLKKADSTLVERERFVYGDVEPSYSSRRKVSSPSKSRKVISRFPEPRSPFPKGVDYDLHFNTQLNKILIDLGLPRDTPIIPEDAILAAHDYARAKLGGEGGGRMPSSRMPSASEIQGRRPIYTPIYDFSKEALYKPPLQLELRRLSRGTGQILKTQDAPQKSKSLSKSKRRLVDDDSGPFFTPRRKVSSPSKSRTVISQFPEPRSPFPKGGDYDLHFNTQLNKILIDLGLPRDTPIIPEDAILAAHDYARAKLGGEGGGRMPSGRMPSASEIQGRRPIHTPIYDFSKEALYKPPPQLELRRPSRGTGQILKTQDVIPDIDLRPIVDVRSLITPQKSKSLSKSKRRLVDGDSDPFFTPRRTSKTQDRHVKDSSPPSKTALPESLVSATPDPQHWDPVIWSKEISVPPWVSPILTQQQKVPPIMGTDKGSLLESIDKNYSINVPSPIIGVDPISVSSVTPITTPVVTQSPVESQIPAVTEAAKTSVVATPISTPIPPSESRSKTAYRPPPPSLSRPPRSRSRRRDDDEEEDPRRKKKKSKRAMDHWEYSPVPGTEEMAAMIFGSGRAPDRGSILSFGPPSIGFSGPRSDDHARTENNFPPRGSPMDLIFGGLSNPRPEKASSTKKPKKKKKK